MITELIQRAKLVFKSLTNQKFDALDILQVDHLKVDTLFIQFKATQDKKRRHQLFDRIKSELDTHTSLEEDIFYPECERYEELRPLILEAYEEHRQVNTLLREIEGLVKDSEKFDPKITVLMENVRHHVSEEEGTLFPKVRKQIDKKTLLEMADRFKKTKRQKAAA